MPATNQKKNSRTSSVKVIDTKKLWVSRIIASKYSVARVYLALNGYRYDNFAPYLFVSEDFGATWKDISSGLPTSSSKQWYYECRELFGYSGELHGKC